MIALVARAPTRIDFGGGWTDVPPYAAEEGGFVCNVAITRYATARLAVRTPTDPVAAPDGEHQLADTALRVAALPHVRARQHNDFPVGAGLGGSSAAGVAFRCDGGFRIDGASESARRVVEAVLCGFPGANSLRTLRTLRVVEMGHDDANSDLGFVLWSFSGCW